MRDYRQRTDKRAEDTTAYRRWIWWLAGGSLLILLYMFLPRQKDDSKSAPAAEGTAQQPVAIVHSPVVGSRSLRHRGESSQAATAEEIVAGKVVQFASARHRVLDAMANRFNVKVPAEVERFFQAAEKGDWEQLNASFEILRKLRQGPEGGDIAKLW